MHSRQKVHSQLTIVTGLSNTPRQTVQCSSEETWSRRIESLKPISTESRLQTNRVSNLKRAVDLISSRQSSVYSFPRERNATPSSFSLTGFHYSVSTPIVKCKQSADEERKPDLKTSVCEQLKKTSSCTEIRFTIFKSYR